MLLISFLWFLYLLCPRLLTVLVGVQYACNGKMSFRWISDFLEHLLKVFFNCNGAMGQ